ncbi:hypothetical protein QT06_C0001G0825 [archaeon GW2011_AR15]|nr:hypothetical protein QT06_C0001G0825 [archaeon GW2011_AR15]MBS3103396.1 hypothetical protein [Candidatus Woesearchaeota archaeon]
MAEDNGYQSYCSAYEKHLEQYGLPKLDEEAFKFLRSVQGLEAISAINLIVFSDIPKLRELSPSHKLLEWEVTAHDPRSPPDSEDYRRMSLDMDFSGPYYPSREFRNVFNGVPQNVAFHVYRSLLEHEIERLH